MFVFIFFLILIFFFFFFFVKKKQQQQQQQQKQLTQEEATCRKDIFNTQLESKFGPILESFAQAVRLRENNIVTGAMCDIQDKELETLTNKLHSGHKEELDLLKKRHEYDLFMVNMNGSSEANESRDPSLSLSPQVTRPPPPVSSNGSLSPVKTVFRDKSRETNDIGSEYD